MTHKTPPTCNTPGRKVPPCCEPRQKAGQATRTDFESPRSKDSALQRGIAKPSSGSRVGSGPYGPGDVRSLPAGYLLPPGWTMVDVRRMDEEIMGNEKEAAK